MKTTLDHKINEEKLKKLKTIFSVHEASKIGLTRLSLKRLTDKGTLLRLENGIYRKHSKSWDVSFVIDSTSSDMLGFPGNKIASTIMWNGIGNEFR